MKEKQLVKVVSRNQYLLFCIYEMLFNYLDFKISELVLENNILMFDIDDYNDIDIKIYGDILILNISKINVLEETINENTYSNVITTILNRFKHLNPSSDYTDQHLFFKFIKLSSIFELSYTMASNLIIYNDLTKLKLIITPSKNEPNVYKVRIKNENKETLFDTLFEYNNEINKLSKFYDKDKSQQIVGIISRLFENKEMNTNE